VVRHQGDPELAEVVGAPRPPATLANRLHGREKEGHQHRDDRDHHEEFDECHASPAGRRWNSSSVHADAHHL